MTCERFEDLLQGQLDGALDKRAEAELQAHLDACPHCRKDQLLYGSIVSAMAEMTDIDCPTLTIRESVMAVVASEPYSAAKVVAFPARRSVRWAWAAIGLAACVLMAIGVISGLPGDDGPAPTVAEVVQPKAKLLPKSPVRPVPLGRFVTLGETVSIMRHGSETWKNASGEVELALGDRVRTGTTCEGILYYEGRGRMTVKANTDLQMIASGIRLRRGSTWIKIARRGKGFYAETPNAVAAVRGTIYTVEVSEDLPIATRVNVFRGAVAVTPGSRAVPLGDSVLVTKDETVEVCGQIMATKRPLELAAYQKFGMDAPQELVDAAVVHPVVDTAVDDVHPSDTGQPTDEPSQPITSAVKLLDDDDDTDTASPASAAAQRPR